MWLVTPLAWTIEEVYRGAANPSVSSRDREGRWIPTAYSVMTNHATGKGVETQMLAEKEDIRMS